MKTIAAAISAIAIVNLLALLVAGGWLWQSDRLSPERIDAVRELFSVTNAEEATQAEDAAAQAEREEQIAAEERKQNRPPLTADEQLATMSYTSEQAEISIARTKQELEILRQSLNNEKTALLRQRQQLEDKELAFEQRQEDLRVARESDQFEKALSLYQGLDAAAVKNIWMTLIQSGQTDQVVTYLGAMQARKATEVVAEFEKEDPTLAADLLERLRTHGFSVATSEDG
jgi:hypothetical protein